MITSKYAMFVKFKAKPGKIEELCAVLTEASKLVLTAKGCQLYILHKEIGVEDCISVYELWDSQQDHDDSLKIDGTRELIAKAMPLLDGMPEGIKLEAISCKGM